MISENGLTSCGSFTWQITKLDETLAIDSEVYTVGDLDSPTKTILIYTDDISKSGNADSQDFRVTVYYTDYPLVIKTLDTAF